MPSLSLLSRANIVLFTLFSTAFATTYEIQDVYEGLSFLDGFDFFTETDPTNGFVTYVNRSTAHNKELVKIAGTDTYIGVDFETTLAPTGPGRDSVRIESKMAYTQGLFVVDIKHMPGGK
jgi:hypothetical protein